MDSELPAPDHHSSKPVRINACGHLYTEIPIARQPSQTGKFVVTGVPGKVYVQIGAAVSPKVLKDKFSFAVFLVKLSRKALPYPK